MYRYIKIISALQYLQSPLLNTLETQQQQQKQTNIVNNYKNAYLQISIPDFKENVRTSADHVRVTISPAWMTSHQKLHPDSPLTPASLRLTGSAQSSESFRSLTISHYEHILDVLDRFSFRQSCLNE